MKAKLRKAAESIYLYLMFMFLYVPIAVLMVFSFNEAKSRGVWGGFSLKWYEQMFSDSALMSALRTTIIVGILSALISCVIGTAAAIGIQGFRRKKVRNVINEITNIPMVSSELVIGVSLMLLFIALGIPRGMLTMLLAHITFNIPYVILSVTPKLMQLDSNLYEAAVDLGAKPWYAFKNVVLPEIMPGVINGLLLAFTLSIDDFVISFFTTGNGVSNLSIYVYSTAKRLNPKINALSTLMFLAIMLLLFIINKRTSKDKDSNVLIN
ncbi:MAG: ABC transporter permease [Clostridia bacterium]|nr:ABC transporter permease [Clostridia bacterium]